VVTDTDLSNALTNKQDKLIAGNNITIDASTNIISSSGGGTTIDSTTDLSCNTLTTTSDATIGGTLSIGSETLDTKISNAITGKQNTINARNNLTITNDVLDVDENIVTNSLVIRPSILKANYTPATNGEIRATTLTIDDYLNGVVYDVKDTLNQEQNNLIAGENISIDAFTNIISSTGGGTTIDSTTDLSCNTLTTIGDATMGGILTLGNQTLDTKISNAISGKQNEITARNNLTITNDVLDVDEDVVTNSLVIRPSFLKESYTPSVAGEIRATTLTIDDYANGVVYDVKETLNQKQNRLLAGENITITKGLKSDTISASGGITQTELDDALLLKQGTMDSTTELSCKTLNTFGDIIINSTGGKTQNVGSLLTTLGSQQFQNTNNISTNSGNITTLQNNTLDLPTIRENISNNATSILNKPNALSFNTNNIGIQSIVVSTSFEKGRNVAGQVLSDTLSTTGNASVGGTLTIGGETLDAKLNTKQNTLTAGTNIIIVGNTISVTGGGGGTTIDSTTDLTCNTLTTNGDASIGGVITAPNQISFRATSTASILINTSIALPFNKITYNVGNGYNATNYTFTAPRTGTYFFYCVLYTNSDGIYAIDYLRNDDGTINSLLYRLQRSNAGTGRNTYLPASFTTQLNIGDTIIMKRAIGAVNVFADPYTHWGGSFSWIKRIIIFVYVYGHLNNFGEFLS